MIIWEYNVNNKKNCDIISDIISIFTRLDRKTWNHIIVCKQTIIRYYLLEIIQLDINY